MCEYLSLAEPHSTMEEEDDPVVQEIPVFLSQALSKHLYIYQYPVKPANRDWNDATIVNASIKPRNQLVRLEVGLDTYSDKYCGSKGEQIAWNTDGQQESSRYARDKEKEKSQYFRDGIMDKIVYESNKPCAETERYAVAILQDKEMHCTPIQGIVQLRPSCNYFDKQDKRRKETDRADKEEEDEEETEAQQVTVTFARQETDVIKKAREKSFEFISKRAAEEPWYQALWKHSDTDHADLERLKLFSGTTAASSSLGLRARDYVPCLVPAPPPEEHEPAAQDARLQDRVRQILTSAKLLSFSELLCQVRAGGGAGGAGGAGVEAADLLAALSGGACCVRGLWTARSADLFARRGAVPTEHMQAARDHVLYLFTQNPFVDRRKVAAAVRLPTAEVLEILTGIAKLNPNTGWELLLPPDTTFEAKHPDLVQRYNMYFEGRQRLFNEMMLAENIPKRQRKKSQRDSISSDTMMSPKPRCNSVSEDDSERKRVKNKAGLGQGKRTRNISSSSVHET